MIYVCDAIMGSGKSSSCIDYMNEHSDGKFIYIAPYVDEDKRIRAACPGVNFALPIERWEKAEKKLTEDAEDDIELDDKKVHKISKVANTCELVTAGRNVASTHQAFLYYTQDVLDAIREKQYTLFIDEDVQVLQPFWMYKVDLDMAIKAGYVAEDGDRFHLVKKPEGGTRMAGMFRTLQSRDIVRVNNKKDRVESLFWTMPADLLAAFKDVYVMTYMYEGQALGNLLAMNGMPVEPIGITRDANGYHFDKNGIYVPEYVASLRDKIHICDHAKLNAIGDKKNALSANWIGSHPNEVAQLQKNIYNYFRNVAPGDGDCRMWSTFQRHKSKLVGAGYAKRFVVLNKKATNDYSNCTALVYAANIYMHPNIKAYYSRHGIKVNEDQYALSTMIQWIWRSAIRNGEEIWVYIPSRRMRELFENWLDDLAKGGDGLGAEKKLAM